MVRSDAMKRSPGKALAAWSDGLARHPELLIILFFSLVLRVFLADSSSYWLDELYSVTLYGINHDSAAEALAELASTSVHPPLYQWLLFHWMEAFGHSEAATRSLSTLYGLLSILFLYCFAFNAFGKRIAVGATLIHSIAFSCLYYSLETRSYAQSMFLSALSLYLLQRCLWSLRDGHGWRSVFMNPLLLGFSLCNVLLLLTHYYNVVFIAAQALFCCVWAVCLAGSGLARRLVGAAKAAVPYVLQVVVFLMLWAGTLKSTAERYLGRRSGAGNTSWEGPTQGPFSTFREAVLAENFFSGPIAILVFLLLLAAAIGPRLVRMYRNPGHPGAARTWWWLLVACCAVAPFFFFYLVTLLVDAERIRPRYFIFAVAPTAVLLSLALESFFGLVVRLFRSGHMLGRFYVRNSTFVAVLFALLVAGPDAYRAATHITYDWRGIAKQVVELVQGDPGHDYLIYETSWRPEPTLNYYLHRFSGGEVKVHSNVLRGDDRRKRLRYRKEIDTMNQSDYIVLVFTHHRERQFRNTVRAMAKDFRLVRRQLDDDGFGYILFAPR